MAATGGAAAARPRGAAQNPQKKNVETGQDGAAGQLGVVQPPQPCPSLWMCQAVATATLVRGDARVSGSSEERG